MEQMPSFQVRTDTLTYDDLYKLCKAGDKLVSGNWEGNYNNLPRGYLYSTRDAWFEWSSGGCQLPTINVRTIKRIFKL